MESCAAFLIGMAGPGRVPPKSNPRDRDHTAKGSMEANHEKTQCACDYRRSPTIGCNACVDSSFNTKGRGAVT